MATNKLPILIVTLGICRADHTWSEEVVEMECDPEFEDDAEFNLNAKALGWWAQKQVPDNFKVTAYEKAVERGRIQASVSGSFVIFHEWKTQFDTPQEACPICGEDENIANHDDSHDGILEVHCDECGFDWSEPFKGSTTDAKS